MRILILSCNTGGGHNAAGRAVKEMFEKNGDEAVMLDYLCRGVTFNEKCIP